MRSLHDKSTGTGGARLSPRARCNNTVLAPQTFPGKKAVQRAALKVCGTPDDLPNIAGAMKTNILVSHFFACLLFFARLASGQIAPAAVVITDRAPSEHYIFRCQGTFTYGSAFGYVNYATGEFDSILTSVQPNGTFSGISGSTGRSVSGTIGSSSVTFTYNGATLTASKSSSYGSTRAFAGVWTGENLDAVFGAGAVTAVITSQGQVFASFFQDFGFNAAFGTISPAGTVVLPLLDGRTITGLFSPSYGFFIGSFIVSSGSIDLVSLVRAVPARLGNISTRGFVGTGEQVLIGGFVISDGGKTVLVDAKGPSLAAVGVTNPVQATQISLYSGSQLIASNNGWRNNANAGEITASGLAPTNDRESALQVALEPGAYTVIVSSGDGSTGIGLVEVFGVGDTEGP